jgi:O-antigen ligase
VILFYFLILLLPLTTHPLWTRTMAGVTPIKALGLMIAVCALVHFFRRNESPRFFSAWQARLYGLLLVIAAVSLAANGQDFELRREMLQIYVSLGLLFFVTLVLIDSLQCLRYVLLAMIAATAVASLYVLREWQVYHNIYPGLRPGGVSGDCNYFAASALITLPMAYYFWRSTARTWVRLLCVASIWLTLVAMLLGASRGGFLGLLAGLLMIIWRSRAKLRNLVLVSLTIGPLVLLAPSSPLRRLLQPDYADNLGSDIRIVLWRAGWRMIQEHPLFGVGLGNFAHMSGVYEDRSALYGTVTDKVQGLACNAFLELGAELGLIGLLVFVGILVTTYISLGRVRQRTGGAKANLLNMAATSMQVGLVAFSVSLMFLSGQYLKPFWMLLFLSMCLPVLEAQQRRKLRKREPAKKETEHSQPEPELWYAATAVLGTVGNELVR